MTSQVSSIDSNSWYSILNIGANYWLSYDTSSNSLPIVISQTPVYWQFLDSGYATGIPATGQYLIRPQGYPGYCLDLQPGTGSPVLDVCSTSTEQWYAALVELSSEVAFTISPGSTEVLSADGPGQPGTHLENTIPSDPQSAANVEFDLYSSAYINDPAYSFLPFQTASDGTGATTTFATIVASATPDTTSEAVPDTTTNSVPATTIDTVPASTSDSGPPPSGTPFSFSIINKSVADLGVVAAALLLPPHTNVGCDNCSISGYANTAAGGCDNTATGVEAFGACVENGYVSLATSNIAANMSLDVQLLPGFKVANTFLSLYNASLGSVQVTDLLSLNFTMDFGIPLVVTLDTPVIFKGGFSLTLSSLDFQFNLDDFSSAQVNFGQASVSPLPFHVSAPDIAFTATTGLALRIHLNAITNPNYDVSVDGELTFELGVPRVNITAQLDSNVDQACHPSTASDKIDHAVDLSYDVEAGVYVSGKLNITDPIKDITWSSGQVSPFQRQIYTGDQCLSGDRLKALFLSDSSSSSTGSGNGSPRSTKVTVMMVSSSWSMFCAFLAVGLWFSIM